jgi:UDPglucose 6-dehydrogenase
MKTIVCIGAGYVGGPTMAVIAKHCPEYRIEVVDINPARIAAWNSDELPIYEPGLDEVVKSARGKNLFFYDDVDAHIDGADIIFVSVNTPTKTFGEGAGCAADLQYWERTARQIARVSTKPKIVVEKSTLPVRTAEAMEQILINNSGGVHFEVVSNPEFLAEGTAITDLEKPDRVLIGAHETPSGREALKAMRAIYAHWVPEERIVSTNLWSSELAKLTANAFLAQRISSINAISALCEKTGANVSEVAAAVGMDSRIGPKFLRAGVGFGGSCFRKDILNLAYLSEANGLPEVAEYWKQVVTMNDFQKRRFVQTMLRAMFNTLASRRIAIFGFAFKPETSDTRDSPAITICNHLVNEHAHLAITDPRALDSARRDMADAPNCDFLADPYEAAKDAHAIALLAGWQEYADLDYQRIFDSMAKPAFLFDGCNLLDHNVLRDIGFKVFRTGAAPMESE